MEASRLRNDVVEVPVLSYEWSDEPVEQEPNCCWRLLQPLLQKVGLVLRNTFYLPMFSRNPTPVYKAQLELATERIDKFRRESDFSIEDMTIEVQGKSGTRSFKIRKIESTEVQGKKLRLFLFCFNGDHFETPKGGQTQKWNPLKIKELSECPILVLKALKAQGYEMNSLITTSLGNVVLDGLKYEEDFSILPPTLIINRGLASIKETTNRLISFPMNYVLFGLAKLTGWNANPEQELIQFLRREKQNNSPSLSERKIVILEARFDHYFSENAAFDPSTDGTLAALGCGVFRGSFFPRDHVHERAHHALPLRYFEKDKRTITKIDSIPLNIEEGTNIASVIAESVFMSGDEEFHNCFMIPGNDANENFGTSRDALNLLRAFRKLGQPDLHEERKS